MACLVVLAACAVAGCGGTSGEERPDKSATLLLDSTPNGVHAGIFSAVRRGYDEAEGVHLRVRAPAKATDATKLLLAGRVTFAVLDLHDLALARERHRDLVAVLAIVQRPLAAFRRRHVDDSGAPPYPELVLAATRQTVDTDPALVGATVRAIARGYRFTLTDPESSAQDLIESNPELDRAQVGAQLDGLDAAFVGAAGRFGVLDPVALRRWAAWEARSGIVRRPPDVARMFVARFADQAAREQAG